MYTLLIIRTVLARVVEFPSLLPSLIGVYDAVTLTVMSFPILVMNRIKQLFRRSGQDANAKRIYRRRAVVAFISRRLPFLT
jgi:hypothetical protein